MARKEKLVSIPRKPTKAMKVAAYYAGGVGDGGGSERASFEEEWEAAVEQFLTGKKPNGLLALVRPYKFKE